MGRQVVRDAVMVRDVSWEEAEDFTITSTPDRAMVRKSGQQGICGEGENTLGWYDPDSDSLTKNPTHGRGILICRCISTKVDAVPTLTLVRTTFWTFR